MKKQRIAERAVFTAMMMVVIILVQYTLDASGITRAYYQWWTNWSGIDFVGMLDYMYNSMLYRICAWMFVTAASVLVGNYARLYFERYFA